MLTCLHLMHVAATCGQGTYAPEIFHIRLQEEPTILLYSNSHAEIQTLNIQYESPRRVYLQSLPPSLQNECTTIITLKYRPQIFKMSMRNESMCNVFHRRIQYEFRAIAMVKYRHEIFNTSILYEYTYKVFDTRLQNEFTPIIMVKYRPQIFKTSMPNKYMCKVFHRRIQYKFRTIAMLKYRHEIFNRSMRKEYTGRSIPHESSKLISNIKQLY